MFIILQYSTVQYSTVQISTVQYSAVQYSTVQYNTVQYSKVQYIPWVEPNGLEDTMHTIEYVNQNTKSKDHLWAPNRPWNRVTNLREANIGRVEGNT